jgi:uncharacterized protein YdgA (DUF945 family)
MKSAFIAAGVAVAACAACLGVAVVSGQKVERSLRAMSTATKAHWTMVRVTDERYDRHLFGATHTFTLRAGCDAPDAGASASQAAITIVQHVKHGPFPGLAGFGAATVDTELVMDAATREQVKKFFGAEQPFQAHTSVAFNGATHTHFAVPRFHATGAESPQVDFQGLAGDVDDREGVLEYDVRMPAVSVAVAASAPAAVRMSLNGMHLHARAEGEGDFVLRPVRSQGEVQALELVMAAPGTDAPHKLGLSQLKFSQETSVDNKLMSSIGRLEGVGRIDDTKLDRIEMQSTMKRIDVLTYQGLVRRIMSGDQATCGKSPDTARLMASPEVQAAVLKMLSANPEFSLDRLALAVGGKRAELRYAIGVDGFTAADAKVPLMAGLMKYGYGNLRVNLPEDWVRRSMVYVAQQSGQARQASGAGDQAALVELMLGKVIDQGYVLREGDMLRSEIAVKSGRATINGKPLGAGPAATTGSAAPAPAM